MNLRKYIYFFIFFVYFMTRQMDLYSQKNSYLKILDNYSTINYQFDKYQPPTFNKKIEMPQFYQIQSLPFFCKMEAKWDKKLNIPFRFRLGSVDYVDEMEGKKK